MKTWLWFAVAPVALAAAYSAAPGMEERLTKTVGAVAPVTPVKLPEGVGKAAPVSSTADRAIRLAAFGILAPSEAKALTPSKGVSDVFALQSVLVVDDSPSAVIDGKLVRPGDKVGGGYRVTKIEADAVWLTGPAVKGAKRARQVLHFPEYRDVSRVLPAPKVVPQSAAPLGTKADQMELEKNYRQILEMLKL